jgi:cobalamin biosynthetic protein CobC
VSGPARAVVAAALRDVPWQQRTCTRLNAASLALAGLLSAQRLAPRRTALFAWIADPRAADWHERLAQRGIWVRRFDAVPSLRFGLPADEAGWNTLAAALPDMVRGAQGSHRD